MEQSTQNTLLRKPLKQRETWKPQFTEEKRRAFEKLQAECKPINDMATARELYHSWLWRDPRDRNEWFKKVMSSMEKKHGRPYCETIRSYMTQLKGEDYEIYTKESVAGGAVDAPCLGQNEASSGERNSANDRN